MNILYFMKISMPVLGGGGEEQENKREGDFAIADFFLGRYRDQHTLCLPEICSLRLPVHYKSHPCVCQNKHSSALCCIFRQHEKMPVFKTEF